MISRRQFGALAGGAIGALALGGACHSKSEPVPANDGRLTVRPGAGVATSIQGEIALGLDAARDAILRLPTKATAAPLPLLVLLHGATESAEGVLGRLAPAVDETGIAVLAPNSRDSSWDAIRYTFGPDVIFLNRALERVFEKVPIDPRRISIGGFSDGATYALSLGLINGDLFSRVVAFSPGFVIDGTPAGRPRFFISHGTDDPILPIDRCGRRVASSLKARGYEVTFREFAGGHTVPADIAREGMRWVAVLASESSQRRSAQGDQG